MPDSAAEEHRRIRAVLESIEDRDEVVIKRAETTVDATDFPECTVTFALLDDD